MRAALSIVFLFVGGLLVNPDLRSAAYVTIVLSLGYGLGRLQQWWLTDRGAEP